MEDGRPAGVPVNCVVRVRPAARADARAAVAADGKGVRVRLPHGADASFTFSEVYGAASSTDDLFAREAPRVLKSVVQGYSAAVLVLGQEGSGRSHTLFGRPAEGAPGLASLAGRRLFELLKQKAEAAPASPASSGARSRYDSSRTSFEVRAQFVEVVADTVRDLLAVAPAPDLEVEQGEHGPVVPGAVSRAVHHADDVDELVSAALAARTAEHTDFGPLRPRASAFLTLEVEQRVAPSHERVYSRLTLALMPATGALAEDADRLRAREGPRLNREALAFGALVRRLSDPDTADFADYAVSKTTALLDDVLGGNCVTLCVAAVRPEDAAVSRVTLEYARLFQRVSNYPLLNDERAQGMLRRLRLQVFHLQQELESAAAAAEAAAAASASGAAGGGGVAGEPDEASAAAVVEIKSRLLRSDLDRAALTQEKGRLLERFNEFRGKYTELVQSKAELQDSLIAAEEERLRASRLLVDLQIESAAAREAALTEKYELEARLLALESTRVERDLEDQAAKRETERLAAELAQSEERRKAVGLEFVALRKNYTQLADEKKAQAQDVSQMAVELLSLNNARKALEAQVRDLEASLARSAAENAELREYRERAEGGAGSADARVAEAVAETERLREELARRDVMAAKERAEADAARAEGERRYVQLAMEKGKEAEALQEALRAARDDAAAEAERTGNAAAEARAEAAVARRRAEAAESELEATGAEIGRLHARNEELEAAGRREHESFREKVVALMGELDAARAAALGAAAGATAEEFEVEGGGGGGGGDDGDLAVADPLAGTVGAAMESARAELVAAHRRREAELAAESERRSRRLRRLAADNRRLASRARSLAALVRDVVPPTMEVPELAREGGGGGGDDEVDALEEAARDEENETRRAAERLQQQLAEARAASERHGHESVARAEAFQRQLAALQTENARLRREWASRGGQQAQAETLREVREMLAAHGAGAGGPPSDAATAARIRALEEENTRLRAGTGGGAEGGGERARQNQMKEFQVNVQRRLERERAQFRSRATQAEAENERMQEHMTAELLKYQRHIVELNTRVAYCREHHGGGSGDEARRPAREGGGAGVAKAPMEAW